MNDRTPPPAPRWRAVIGSLALVLLLGVLVGRATGVVGGEGELLQSESPVSSPSDESSATSSSPSSSTPSSRVERTPSPGAAKRDRKKDGERRGRPGALPTDVPGGDELAQRVQDLLGESASTSQALEFRVSSLNVLGASHTTARGNKPRYAAGVQRMAGHARLLESLDVDVVGLQEYELVQHRAFKRLTGDTYGVYPGDELGRGPIRNSIAWRQDTWELTDAQTIPIPYFRGKRVPMPYVLLKHRETGRAAWFINIHNPTSNRKRGDNERWRDLGTRLETALANRLHRRTSLPVVLMGDFNERREAFCKVTGAGLIAANGGSTAPCVPPANHGIDWIFGTRDIAFSDYVRLDSPLVNRLTDHPVLVANARVGS